MEPAGRAASYASRVPSEDEDDDLPYPAPLDRSEFLVPGFNAHTYLSTLQNRHQTLSDLTSELRQRLASLNTELVDLVNSEYAAFLGLGKGLKGGEEKVEGVRVGVMGFVKGVEGVRSKVTSRREEAEVLLNERREIGREKAVALRLLDIADDVEMLEWDLKLDGRRSTHSKRGLADNEESLVRGLDGGTGGYGVEIEDIESSDDDDDNEAGVNDPNINIPINKLTRLTHTFVHTLQTMSGVDPDHPFLATITPQLQKIRETLRLDLCAALKQTAMAIAVVPGPSKEISGRDSKKPSRIQDLTLRLVSLLTDLGEGKAAIKVLSEAKQSKNSK